MRAPTVACLLAAGLLAGCIGGTGPATTGGASTYTVRVEAAPDGDPVANATVVFFTHVADGVEDGHAIGPDVDRAYLRDDEVPNGTVDLAASDPFRVLAQATTGPDGRATAEIDDEDALMSVAVGGVDGLTTEVHVTTFGDPWEGAVSVDPGDSRFDDGQPRTVPLYPTRVPVDVQGTLGFASTLPSTERGTGPYWQPSPLDLSLHHRVRMTRVDLELRWNNTPTASADLYLGAGAGDEPTYTGSDDTNPPAAGPQTETLTVDDPEGRDVHAVGPVTDATTLGETVRYRVTGTLSFAGADVRLPAEGT